jgi:dienelactone hydrolase
MSTRLWPIGLSLVVILTIGGLALGTRAGRRGLVAGLLTLELVDPADIKPLSYLAGEPVREEVRLDAGDRTVAAVVYHPRDPGRHGALVFAMGVKSWPLDDPRFQRLAGSLARAGIVVAAVDSPGLRFDEIRSRDVEDLVLTFDYLSSRPYVDAARAGFLGVSVGGSLAIVAAADPRIARRVAFIDAVGPYFDAGQELEAVSAAGEDRWQPDAETARVVRKQVIDTATEGDDRSILDGIFYFGRGADREQAPGLSPQGNAVLDLLDNRDWARFPALYAAAGLATNGEFNSVSPSQVIDRLQAPLHLLHSRADHHIPFAQSAALQAAARGSSGVSLEAFAAFDHVDPSNSKLSPALAADGVRLYAYLLGLVARLD